MEVNRNLVPPDGGWGWIIMCVYIANNLLVVPVQQNFGLLFKDTFKEMGMSGAGVTSIVTTNMAVSDLIGIGTGPLLKRFGVRKVAVGGALLYTVGITAMTCATSYIHFMILYGFLVAIGVGIIRLTSRLSLNLYFARRRRKVVGVALSIRSFGSIIFPHIVVFLLSIYGAQGAVEVIGGICFHTVCSCLLLRPVEWYMKPSSSIEKFDRGVEMTLLEKKEKTEESIKPKENCSVFQRIIQYYDLSLLKNSTFLSITFGMMFAIFSDNSFSNLFPLILSDLGFSNNDIATFVSVSYISNIIVRFAIPFIGDYLKRSSKFMYGFSCFIVIVGRFVIIFLSRTTRTIAIPIFWGIAKGMRTVYWNVVTADYIPADKLASAESIQLLIYGFVALFCGPLLGIIKDATGTYINCVYVLNVVTFATCVTWSVEWMFNIYNKNKRRPDCMECGLSH